MSTQPVDIHNLTETPAMRRSGLIATAVVMLAAYVTVFLSPDFVFETNTVLLLLGLGFIYTLNMTAGESWLLRHPRPINKALYFIIQILLGAYMVYRGGSGMWLVLLPLVSTAVQHLPRFWSVLAILGIWAGQVLPFLYIYGVEVSAGWAMPFLAAIIFVAVFTQLMVNEQHARLELAAAHQKLREYAAQVEELAVVQERNRLAREIHDGLGHYLTAINIQIKAAQALVEQDPQNMKTALADAQTLTQEALADVRRSITSLRADPTTSRPLTETLDSLLKEAGTTGLEVDFQVRGVASRLAPQIEFTLYRLAQEGLTNIRKHAQATRASLQLDYLPNGVRLTLEDNGQGAGQTEGGFGLMGVRERVELMHGTLNVQTSPGKGFRLEANLPNTPPEA
ncbi:MAG: sensor histidine kinase [Anaerolineaceae bacterium]|nr:sensor histidine kinase [Anaerolineaceae bacterium]